MQVLIYFTRTLPGLSNVLDGVGFRVYEALTISEVHYLVEQHPTAHIVIDHTVEDHAAQELAPTTPH